MTTNEISNNLLELRPGHNGTKNALSTCLTDTALQSSMQRESCLICEELAAQGIAIAWHNFELVRTSMLADSLACPPGSLRLCLNLSGNGSLSDHDKTLHFEPLNVFVYAAGNDALSRWRKPGERHRFLTIDFSISFMRDQLANCVHALSPVVRDFIRSGGTLTSLGRSVSLTQENEQLISILLRPQCTEGCCHFRCKGIAMQLMAEFLMKPCCGDQTSCDRQKCVGQERARKVISILVRNLIEPPTLEEIGREIGCSPFHLSRTFSREIGMTIPQYLRTLRMRHAAELLRNGRCNVTEAAMAVGYSSLSHFSRVFCQTLGCCPGAYSSSAQEPRKSACANPCSAQSDADPRLSRRTLTEINVLQNAVGLA